VLTLLWNVKVTVPHKPAPIVRAVVVFARNELVVSVPPPVDVLKIVLPPILIDCRLPLGFCGQLMVSAVSNWLVPVLFWNVTTTVFVAPEGPRSLPPTTTPAGVAVAVGVGVGVGDAVGVGLCGGGGPPGMVMNAHP
jgi:hypothetical protein